MEKKNEMRILSVFAILLFFFCTLSAFAQEEAATWMPDVNLRAAVIKQLKLPKDVSLTKEHLKALTKLEIPERSGVGDLTGLEHAVRLEEIGTCDNPIQGLGPLANLVNLKTLVLSENRIRGITAVRYLTQLTKLDLAYNFISDIEAVSNLKNLNGSLAKDLLYIELTA